MRNVVLSGKGGYLEPMIAQGSTPPQAPKGFCKADNTVAPILPDRDNKACTGKPFLVVREVQYKLWHNFLLHIILERFFYIFSDNPEKL